MKKEIKKAMGISPVTGRIYYGNLRGDEWIGGKEDVTETAVRAVFEWFVEKFEDVCPADGQYTLEFLDEEYALTMKRKSFEYPARWKNRAEHNDYIHAECSKCGFQVESIEAVETGRCSAEYTKVKWKYCPKCGSKMTV